MYDDMRSAWSQAPFGVLLPSGRLVDVRVLTNGPALLAFPR